MSTITLAVSLLSPLVGGFLARASIKLAMIIGALLSAIGYFGLSSLSDFRLALAMYVMIGAGICLLAILGPLILVNRWFITHRAKVLSIVNLPIMMFAAPFLVAELLALYGRTTVLAAFGALFLLIVMLLIFLIDDPAKIWQAPRGTTDRDGSVQTDFLKKSAVSRPAIMRSSRFWLLSYGIAAIAGSGVAFLVHIIPFGTGRGMTPQAAALLLSVYAGSGIFGTLLFGWICDRAGSQVAVFLSALIQSLLWLALLYVDNSQLLLVASVLGVCIVPMITYHGAALSELFGAAEVSRAMGYSYALKMPVLFCFPPLLGLLFQKSGDYSLAFFTTAMIMLSAALALFVMCLISRSAKLKVTPLPA